MIQSQGTTRNKDKEEEIENGLVRKEEGRIEEYNK